MYLGYHLPNQEILPELGTVSVEDLKMLYL